MDTDPDLNLDSIESFENFVFDIGSEYLDLGDDLDLNEDLSLSPKDQAQERPFVCSICSASYKSATHLRRHNTVHLFDRPFRCLYCAKGFNRKEQLGRHVTAIHSRMRFKCEFCDKELSRRDHLARHIKQMHNVDESDAKSIGQPSPPPPPPPTVPPPEKKKKRVTKKLQPTPQPETRDDDSNAKKKFPCPHCSRSYTRREKRAEHIRNYHEGVKFKCEYCEKVLSRKDGILRHHRSMHPEILASKLTFVTNADQIPNSNIFTFVMDVGAFDAEESSNSNSSGPVATSSSSSCSDNQMQLQLLIKSICQFCLKVFGSSYHLARHVESVHSGGARPHSCPNCAKQFKRRDHLLGHLKLADCSSSDEPDIATNSSAASNTEVSLLTPTLVLEETLNKSLEEIPQTTTVLLQQEQLNVSLVHLMNFPNQEIQNCFLVPSNEILTASNENSELLFSCGLCELSCLSKDQLLQHLTDEHHGSFLIKPFDELQQEKPEPLLIIPQPQEDDNHKNLNLNISFGSF